MQTATGWSIESSVDRAVSEAWDRLRAQLPTPPALLFVYGSHKHDPARLAAALARVAPGTRIVGGTSCLGVLTEDGLHLGPDGHALGLFGIVDEAGAFGVAAEPLGDDARGAARRATERALADAGRPGEMPDGVWVVPVPGSEELVIQGIDEVFNAGVPVFGGTVADDTIEGNWAQYSTGAWHTNAVAIAVLFASAPVVFSFHSGYEPTEHRGVVTRAAGRTVYEIDHRPAARVYDEWSRGALRDILDCGGNVLSRTTLHPLGTVVGAVGGLPYYRLVHPERVTADGAMSLFANIAEGTEVAFMSGSVESLTSRAGRVARTALETHVVDPSRIAGSLVTYCAGCRLTVGDGIDEVCEGLRTALPGGSFLGLFSFGEQGCFAGGENRHGNLMISVLTLLGSGRDE